MMLKFQFLNLPSSLPIITTFNFLRNLFRHEIISCLLLERAAMGDLKDMKRNSGETLTSTAHRAVLLHATL